MRRAHSRISLALLVLLGTGAGCVVPVGPKWTDPQSNYPPTLDSAVPPMGSILASDTDGGAAPGVEVWLADQNTGDKLYVRWIIDYPPFVAGRTRIAALPLILPPADEPERPAISFTPNCSDDQIAHGSSNHRLLLVVSDRPFSSDDPNQTTPDQVPAGNFRVEASWQFVLDCQ